MTGLSLEDARRPRVAKKLKRRLQQEIHFVDRFGIQTHAGNRGYRLVQAAINAIHGSIQFVRGIEPARGEALNRMWRAALAKEGIDPTIAAGAYGKGKNALFVVDESVSPDGDWMMLCLVVVEDIDRIRDSLVGFLKELAARPYAANLDRLKREGLHWNALDEDDRTKAVEHLVSLPFKAFIARCSLPGTDRQRYASTYGRLLDKLLERRLTRFGGARVTLKAEENSKVSAQVLANAMTAAYRVLENSGSRRPAEQPATAMISKGDDAVISLPDIVLGVVAKYALSGQLPPVQAVRSRRDTKPAKRLPGEQAARRFRQIEGKIRAIYDLDTGQVFSRRNPFRAGS